LTSASVTAPFQVKYKKSCAVKGFWNPQNGIEYLEKATKSTYLFLNGPCSAVKIGKSHLTRDQVVQNILECTELIVKKIPKKWNNIQSIHIKSTDSISLPIYNKLPTPLIRVNKEKEEDEIEEEEEEEGEDEEGEEGEDEEGDDQLDEENWF